MNMLDISNGMSYNSYIMALIHGSGLVQETQLSMFGTPTEIPPVSVNPPEVSRPHLPVLPDGEPCPIAVPATEIPEVSVSSDTRPKCDPAESTWEMDQFRGVLGYALDAPPMTAPKYRNRPIPFINHRGDLVIPFRSPRKYHVWKTEQGTMTLPELLLSMRSVIPDDIFQRLCNLHRVTVPEDANGST